MLPAQIHYMLTQTEFVQHAATDQKVPSPHLNICSTGPAQLLGVQQYSCPASSVVVAWGPIPAFSTAKRDLQGIA